jgi:hypothetical protein
MPDLLGWPTGLLEERQREFAGTREILRAMLVVDRQRFDGHLAEVTQQATAAVTRFGEIEQFPPKRRGILETARAPKTDRPAVQGLAADGRFG